MVAMQEARWVTYHSDDVVVVAHSTEPHWYSVWVGEVGWVVYRDVVLVQWKGVTFLHQAKAHEGGGNV